MDAEELERRMVVAFRTNMIATDRVDVWRERAVLATDAIRRERAEQMVWLWAQRLNMANYRADELIDISAETVGGAGIYERACLAAQRAEQEKPTRLKAEGTFVNRLMVSEPQYFDKDENVTFQYLVRKLEDVRDRCETLGLPLVLDEKDMAFVTGCSQFQMADHWDPALMGENFGGYCPFTDHLCACEQVDGWHNGEVCIAREACDAHEDGYYHAFVTTNGYVVPYDVLENAG